MRKKYRKSRSYKASKRRPTRIRKGRSLKNYQPSRGGIRL